MRRLAVLVFVLACACDGPGEDLDAGRDAGSDAGAPVDAGPPVDHDRAGLVPIVDSCEIPPTPAGDAIAFVEDEEYAVVGGESLRLDVAHPLDGAGHPLVVMIHGGAWMIGDKTDERPRDFVRRLASIGYAAASINYRLATEDGQNLFPAAVEDVRCAVRWLIQNADRYGADASRVVAVGASAGGHLAMMLDVAADAEGFDGSCALTEPFTLAGAISFYGAYDLRPSAAGGSLGDALVRGFLGGSPVDLPGVAAQASPIVYLDADDPPPLMLHGGGDPLVPPEQGRDMQAAFEDVGVASTYVEVPLAPHAFSLITEEPRYRTASCTTLAYLEAVAPAR